jgi:hypothetical protein
MVSFLNSDQFQIGPATIGLTSPHSDVSQVCRWTRMSKRGLAFVIVLAPRILGCAFESSRAATIAPHPSPPHVAQAPHPPPHHVVQPPHPQPAPVTKKSIFVQPLHTIQNSNFGNQPVVAGRAQQIAAVQERGRVYTKTKDKRKQYSAQRVQVGRGPNALHYVSRTRGSNLLA